MRATRKWRPFFEMFPPILISAAALGIGVVGVLGPVTATLKLGPTTGRHLRGFAPFYEIEDSLATRWTTYHALASFPLVAHDGPFEVSYRFSRVFPQTAIVEVRLGEAIIDRFECRGGGFQVRRRSLGALKATPLDLRFASDSHERRNLGLRLDWIRVSAAEGARFALRGPALWLPAAFSAALWILLRLVGHSRFVSSGLVAAVIGAMAVFLHRDPFGFAHVSLALGWPALVAAVIAAAVSRALGGGRWLLPLLIAGYLIKGAGLFHPASFYPDYQNAREFIMALAKARGGLAERTLEAQVATEVAYPRMIAGRAYAFPYSPLFFLPFTALKDADTIEEAYRHVGLALTILEALAVFLLARMLVRGRRSNARERSSGDDVPLLATLIAIILPPLFSRLLLAMTVTLAGHFFDVCLVAATLACLRHGSRRLLIVALCALASLLVYVSSLFTVGAFLIAIAALERRHAPRLLAVLGVSVLLVIFWLYHPFAQRFLAEILPAVMRGATMSSESRQATSLLVPTLGRVPLFYGWAYPFFTVAGLFVARRRLDRAAVHVLIAYGLAFFMLVGLRVFGRGLFRDLKEITFLAPLVAISTAFVISALARLGPGGRLAAAFVLVGLTFFGMAKHQSYLDTYASPVLRVREAGSERASAGASGGRLRSPIHCTLCLNNAPRSVTASRSAQM